MLIDSQDGITALLPATFWGHIDVVKALLAAGAGTEAREVGTSCVGNTIDASNSVRDSIMHYSFLGGCDGGNCIRQVEQPTGLSG